jgi:hypothetical protein
VYISYIDNSVTEFACSKIQSTEPVNLTKATGCFFITASYVFYNDLEEKIAVRCQSIQGMVSRQIPERIVIRCVMDFLNEVKFCLHDHHHHHPDKNHR